VRKRGGEDGYRRRGGGERGVKGGVRRKQGAGGEGGRGGKRKRGGGGGRWGKQVEGEGREEGEKEG